MVVPMVPSTRWLSKQVLYHTKKAGFPIEGEPAF